MIIIIIMITSELIAQIMFSCTLVRKKKLNRFTKFLLRGNESTKEIVRIILNFSRLVNYY